MTDTERKPDAPAESPEAGVVDTDLDQVVGGAQDIHFTKPIDKPSPVFFP
jgi:hypothetical protein